MNNGTIRVRRWVKSYLRKVNSWGRTSKRRRVKGHFITVFINKKEVQKGDGEA